jgi:hypothetical protein
MEQRTFEWRGNGVDILQYDEDINLYSAVPKRRERALGSLLRNASASRTTGSGAVISSECGPHYCLK